MDSGVTMSIWDGLIQGGIALIICIISGLIVKVFIARTFKGIDDNIKNGENRIDKLESKLEGKVEKNNENIIRLQEVTKEFSKNIDALRKNSENIDKLRVEFLEKYQPKADFVREIQILNSQLESAHKMITRLDEKIEAIKRN